MVNRIIDTNLRLVDYQLNLYLLYIADYCTFDIELFYPCLSLTFLWSEWHFGHIINLSNLSSI